MFDIAADMRGTTTVRPFPDFGVLIMHRPPFASLFGDATSYAASNRNDFGTFADILASQFGYLTESQSTPRRDQNQQP